MPRRRQPEGPAEPALSPFSGRISGVRPHKPRGWPGPGRTYMAVEHARPHGRQCSSSLGILGVLGTLSGN